MTVEEFGDVVALWWVKEKSAGDVVFAACDLLMEDVPAPSLAVLAAVSRREADVEVPIRLRDVLPELGLEWHDRGTIAAKEAALRAMSRRTLAGELAPGELTRWVHRKFGHAWIELADGLAGLDDVYDNLDATGGAETDVDEEVFAEVRRITS